MYTKQTSHHSCRRTAQSALRNERHTSAYGPRHPGRKDGARGGGGRLLPAYSRQARCGVAILADAADRPYVRVDARRRILCGAPHGHIALAVDPPRGGRQQQHRPPERWWLRRRRRRPHRRTHRRPRPQPVAPPRRCCWAAGLLAAPRHDYQQIISTSIQPPSAAGRSAQHQQNTATETEDRGPS